MSSQEPAKHYFKIYADGEYIEDCPNKEEAFVLAHNHARLNPGNHVDVFEYKFYMEEYDEEEEYGEVYEEFLAGYYYSKTF